MFLAHTGKLDFVCHYSGYGNIEVRVRDEVYCWTVRQKYVHTNSERKKATSLVQLQKNQKTKQSGFTVETQWWWWWWLITDQPIDLLNLLVWNWTTALFHKRRTFFFKSFVFGLSRMTDCDFLILAEWGSQKQQKKQQ